MYTDVRLQIVRGAFAALGRVSGVWNSAIHGRLNILQDEWDVLTTEVPWDHPDVVPARNAFETALVGGIRNAGLPPFALSAEYVATAIVCLVDPINWYVASTFMTTVSGVKLATSEGDMVDARQALPADRLFSLVLYVAKSPMAMTTVEKVRVMDTIEASTSRRNVQD